MTTTKLREQVLNIIIAGNLSFSQVENPALVSLLKDAYLDCILLSRRVVTDLLHSGAQEAKRDIIKRLANLDSKVSLALDI